MSDPYADYLENVALLLSATVLLSLWVGAADYVGSLGLQPLKDGGCQTWAPPAFLLATITFFLVVYNLTHIIGTVEQSVEQDLSPSLQVIYGVLVVLWVASCVRVLVTGPGQPGDATEGGRQVLRDLHRLLCMTTIEYLTRNEKNDKKLNFDQGLVGNVQASLGSNPMCWLIPACPPSGDGCTFPYTVVPSEDAHLVPAPKRDLAISGTEDARQSLRGNSRVSDTAGNNRVSQPCIESTAEPTCIEQQQDGCVAAETAGEDHLDDV